MSNNAALTIPCGSVDINGYDVPVGLQLVSKRTLNLHDDMKNLLCFAKMMEERLDIFERIHPAFRQLRYTSGIF